jgi:hypothetical protein
MKRTFILLITIVLVLFLVPSVALAADTNLDGYNDNDFNKVQAFLDQPSDIAGQTNGQCLNPSYDRLNPLTWLFPTWSSGTEKRLTQISLSSLSLAGPMDVSGCDQLDYLAIIENKITSLNTSGDTALQTLNCDNNLLSSINVSSNIALQELSCKANNLTSLNASTNTALQILSCKGNHLTSLNIPATATLTEISCPNNALTALDVSHNSNLQKLDFSGNALTALDVSANPALTKLYFSGNTLTTLDVSHNTSLQQLDCSGNALTVLDFSHNPSLQALACNNNKLHTLDLSKCPNMTTLISSGNALTKIDAQLFGASVKLNAVGNGTVELYALNPNYFATAVPGSPSPFVNWTSSGTQVSTDTKYTLTLGSAYNLNANFTTPTTAASATAAPVSNLPLSLYKGGRTKLTPTPSGGTWYWDKTFVELKQNSDGTFTIKGLQPGTTTLRYTYGYGEYDYSVTILATKVPQTGQDFTAVYIFIILACCASGAGVWIGIRKHTKRV